MPTTRLALLASTALTVAALSGPAAAQNDPSCQGLLDRVEALPQELPDDVDWTIEDVRAAEESGDAEACAIILADVERFEDGSGQGAQDRASDTAQAEADAQAEDEMTAVESAQTRVTLEDEAVVEGTVFIDRERASVEVSEGQTEVTVNPGQPEVNVTEQAAQITVREQPARITVEMAQPTIRIEQPAPEIIITMPEPGVDVANAEPQVSIRQAEPTVTVTQASPTVDLELQVAENADDSQGIAVEDRDTGERMAMGESRQLPSEEADVRVTRAEPIVRMERQQGEDQARVNVSRAEPTISYERADPEVSFAQSGEPSVEFAQSGEPTVTIRRSGEGSEGDQASAAMGDDQQTGQQDMAQQDTQGMATEGSEMEQAEAELEQAGENLETAAEQTGQGIENTAEAAGQEIETAADEAGQEITEETRELAAEAEGAPEDDNVRLTEGDVASDGGTAQQGDMQQTDMAQGTDGGMAQPDGRTPMDLASLTMDDLDGAPLYGANGERIGEVSEAVLAEDGLRVTGAVVEIGGFLGLGEHHVMVELDQMQFFRSDVGDEVEAYVSMTEEELESMPEWRNQ
jgi:hypothetical protein